MSSTRGMRRRPRGEYVGPLDLEPAANRARRGTRIAMPMPPLQEEPAPELEAHERPELQIEWSAALVQCEQTFDIARVEDLPIPAALGKKKILEDGIESATEPAA